MQIDGNSRERRPPIDAQKNPSAAPTGFEVAQLSKALFFGAILTFFLGVILAISENLDSFD